MRIDRDYLRYVVERLESLGSHPRGFRVAGTPEECILRIQEYRDAGCTHIMLEIWGDDRTGQAKLFGEAVLPHFRN